MPVLSAEPDDAFAMVLRGLSASANRANLARSAVIAAALQAAGSDELSEAARAAAAAAAHQVAGSAGTFGLPRASQLAAGLEHFFVELGAAPSRGGPVEVEAPEVAEAGRRLRELTDLLAESAHQDVE